VHAEMLRVIHFDLSNSLLINLRAPHACIVNN